MCLFANSGSKFDQHKEKKEIHVGHVVSNQPLHFTTHNRITHEPSVRLRYERGTTAARPRCDFDKSAVRPGHGGATVQPLVESRGN